MAGIMTVGDEGKEIPMQQVPSIDPSVGATAPIVASAHVSSDFRAEGVNYNETPGVSLTTAPYPQGTVMSDSTPNDDVN